MQNKLSPLSKVRQELPKAIQSLLDPLIEYAAKEQIPMYLVGGCVRDLLLHRVSLDIDIVVEGSADTLARSAAKSLKAKLVSHPQFLTHTLLLKNGRHLDIATARTETYPEPAALPVVEPASLQDDLYRRDFSINAMAISLNKADFGHIWDPFGGMEDLQAKKIRVLHAQSFKDDPTRIFRAARFAGRFNYELEWRTREWLNEAVSLQIPASLSGARLREEFIPLLMEADPRHAFQLLAQWGALSFLIPNLKWEKAHQTLFGHVLKQPSRGDVLLCRMLALLYAIPFTKAVGSLGHLMFPQKTIEQVEQALSLLARLREGGVTRAVLKSTSKHPLRPEVKQFVTQALKVKSIGGRKEAQIDWQRVQDSTPTLTGQDVRDLGYKPGPIFSKIFEALRQARWEGKLRTREEEIRFLQSTFPVTHGK